MSTAVHEASHAAACLFLERPVEFVYVSPGFGWPGEEVGRCRAPIPRREGVQARDLGVALVGYMAEDDPDWPPPYERAMIEDREALATLIRVLDVNPEQYEEVVLVTRNLLADPYFRRLRDVIARALCACPRLESDDLAALAEATGRPTEAEEDPCPN